MRLYLDANVFIFAALGDNADSRTQKAQAVLSRIIERKDTGFTSVLTIDEVVWVILKRKKDRDLAIDQGLRLLKLPIIRLPCSEPVSFKGLQLMRKYSQLSPRDAIHAATCIEIEGAAFVSDDKDFEGLEEIKHLKL